MQVKPKRLPYFKVGKELRERIADGLQITGELPALAPATTCPSLLETPAEKS